MAKYALIGKSLVHSQSKSLHKLIENYDYDYIEIPSEKELSGILKDTQYDGFNVTNPYKDAVIPYLDEVSEKAKLANAVNAIKRESDGRLIGYNTDISGFARMVGNRVEGRRCLVLGTGGAARGTAVAMEHCGAEKVVLVSRNPEAATEKLGKEFPIVSYEMLGNYYDAQVLVNATPVGMVPNNEVSPINDIAGATMKFFENLELAVDVIYNPYRTKFLQDAHRLTGCKTISGLEMLIYQAVESSHIWNGYIDDEAIDNFDTFNIKRQILKNQLNIVAIGMPGSGKTTIFRRYAYEMGLPFIDIDQETEKLMGEKIEDALARGYEGEIYFREMEQKAVLEASKKTGTIIATGGGSILNPINRDLLRSNGLVIYMKRPLDKLAVDNRPISQSVGVEELYNERDRIYKRMADMTVFNSRTFGEKKAETGEGNSYHYELKKYVYSLDKKIERRLDEIANNKWA